MILDETFMFSDDQDLSQVAGAYDSTNVIDLGVDRDMGNGVPIPLLIQVTEDFASGGSATLQVVLETDDNEAMASSEILYTSEVIVLATLVAGYKFVINFLPRENQQYLQLVYTIGTATTTAGTVTAGITWGDQASFTG